ncbi:hypothetical protein FACS1894182_04060 [Bacteroidia bacterium]|nr:hypothetical protein FACS1894182_04060 [Bacteroidia bacterium]
MKVYHGSDTQIEEIDIEKCKYGKDFGRGLYVTNLKEQAETMAARVSRWSKEKPVVTEFEFDEFALIDNDLKILVFENYTEEWFDFVISNRKNKKREQIHEYDAEVAVEHILGQQHPMSYKAIPGVVYTNPEIAGVGKTEDSLLEEGMAYTVKKLPMAYSGRFVAENEVGNGVCKIIEGEDGTILGVHILGNPASEIIVIAGIAIEKGMKAEDLKAMVFPHPTVGEIIKETL